MIWRRQGLIKIRTRGRGGVKRSRIGGKDQSVQAIVIKSWSLDVLNSRCLFSYSPGTQKSKIKVPSGLVSGETFLPGLQMSVFSPCPYRTFPQYSHGERALVALPFKNNNNKKNFMAFSYNIASVLSFDFLASRHLGCQLPDHRSNLHPLHWKAKSQTLGSPFLPLLNKDTIL